MAGGVDDGRGADPAAAPHDGKGRASLAGAVGNLLEWYDFAAYGYFGAVIGRSFFPSDNPATSLLAAFAVFAAAFFMRPLGGVLFGHVGDRYGRGPALLLSAGLMTVSTVAIGLLPTYESIGILAPVLLVLLRLGQGLSVGGEYTASAIFLVETARPERRGLSGSLACLGAGGGMLLGSLVGVAVTEWLDPAAVAAWGWRIPFLLGLGLGLVVLVLRRNMAAETSASEPRAAPRARPPLAEALAGDGGAMLRAFLMNLAPAASFYVAFVYLVTFLQTEDGLTARTAFLLNTVVMVAICAITPMMGALSDRVGRKRLLVAMAIGLALLSWPLFWLIDSREPGPILLGQLGFAVLVGGYAATMPATLVEMFRSGTRCTATALSYNAAYALVGGTAPMVAAALVHTYAWPTGPGLYIALLALVSLAALVGLPDRTGRPLRA